MWYFLFVLAMSKKSLDDVSNESKDKRKAEKNS